MVRITSETLPQFQKFLSDHGLDGWLIYDFHGINPFARLLAPQRAGVTPEYAKSIKMVLLVGRIAIRPTTNGGRLFGKQFL